MIGEGGARAATPADSGKACPYCRFALKSGGGVVDCPSCSATHHDECWGDNGGCAVMGCASAPSLAGGVPAPTATARQPPPPPPPPPPAYPSPHATAPAPPQRRGTPVLTASVLLLALALTGAAVALVLSSRSAPSEPVASDAPPPTVTVTNPPSSPQTRPDRPVEAVDAAEIETLLQRYYGAVRTGGFARAWQMLSPTYKSWKAGNGGFAKWQEQESRNRAQLRVGDLDVNVRSFDASTGVATIFVGGMRFEQRDGTTCAYEGITWARRFGGEWLYDQGYLQNAPRAAVWRPRRLETLGGGCDESGY